jgi:hypothetical protein
MTIIGIAAAEIRETLVGGTIAIVGTRDRVDGLTTTVTIATVGGTITLSTVGITCSYANDLRV